MEQLLKLPKASLTKDLEEILEEAIRNYKGYEKLYEESEERLPFIAPAHAVFLLGELGAINSLPTINKFFSQERDILEFWFGDLKTEELWQPIYKLAQSDITQLLPYLATAVPDVFSKTPHMRAAFTYLGSNRNERQLIPAFKATFQKLILQAKTTPAFTDENSNLTHAVFFALDYGLIELDDEVEIAVKESLIEDYGPSSWEIVHKELVENEPEIKIQDIYEHYEDINEWHTPSKEIDTDWSFKENNDSRSFEYAPPKEKYIDPRLKPKKIYDGSGPFKKTTPTVGRNEPCPCGSGKKYKKCCLRK